MSATVEQILNLTDLKEIKLNREFNFKIFQAKAINNDFQILYTDGLKNHLQEVNEDNLGLECIELYILLPEYWNLENESYPIDWLEKIASVPQKNNTWFGNGDTIPAGKPAENLSENFEANHFILRKPNKLAGELETAELGFQFLSVIPIFQNEIDFKLKNSHSMLFKKMDAFNYTELWDVYRPSSIRSLFKRFFSPYQMR